MNRKRWGKVVWAQNDNIELAPISGALADRVRAFAARWRISHTAALASLLERALGEQPGPCACHHCAHCPLADQNEP